MGFFDRFFNASAGSDIAASEQSDEQSLCDSCGRLIDDFEIEEGECSECRADDYTGAKYCCGAIYEDGEDTCMSCGEPL